jgi:hypothetical protein
MTQEGIKSKKARQTAKRKLSQTRQAAQGSEVSGEAGQTQTRAS